MATGSQTNHLKVQANGWTAYVRFIITGDLPDPNIITSLLQLHPISTRSKSKNHPGNWQISSRGHVSSPNLNDHFDFLLDQIHPEHMTLKQLLKDLELTAWFNIHWRMIDVPHGPILSSYYLTRLAELDADLSFYIRGIDEE
jgi:Domain of unknown function (DUF4279)